MVNASLTGTPGSIVTTLLVRTLGVLSEVAVITIVPTNVPVIVVPSKTTVPVSFVTSHEYVSPVSGVPVMSYEVASSTIGTPDEIGSGQLMVIESTSGVEKLHVTPVVIPALFLELIRQ